MPKLNPKQAGLLEPITFDVGDREFTVRNFTDALMREVTEAAENVPDDTDMSAVIVSQLMVLVEDPDHEVFTEWAKNDLRQAMWVLRSIMNELTDPTVLKSQRK